MARSNLLRSEDYRCVFRLTNECVEVGSDPILWRQVLSEGVRKLTGTAVISTLDFDSRRSRSITADTSFHLWTGGDASTLDRWFGEFASRNLNETNAHAAKLYSQVMDDGVCLVEHVHPRSTWVETELYRQWFWPIRLAPEIMTYMSHPRTGRAIKLAMFAEVGSTCVTERHCQMIKLLQEEIGELLGHKLHLQSRPSITRLTPRRRQTLKWVLKGRSEKEIAKEMRIKQDTVHEHIAKLFEFFDVHSRSELMALFISQALHDRI